MWLMQIQLPRGGEHGSEEMDTEEQAGSSGNQVPLLSFLAPQLVWWGIYVSHSMHSSDTAAACNMPFELTSCWQ